MSLACSDFVIQFLVQRRCRNRYILSLSFSCLFFRLRVEDAHGLNLFKHHNLLEESHFGRWLLANFTAIEIVVKSIIILIASLAGCGFNFFHAIQLYDCVDICDILWFLIF